MGRMIYVIVSVTIATILTIGYISNLIIKNDTHYDVKKNSLIWMVVMNNSTITEFPVIEPKDFAQYNWKGYNHTPYSIVEWNLHYVTERKLDYVRKRCLGFLKEQGYLNVKKTKSQTCTMEIFPEKNNSREYYTSGEKGSCLSLVVTQLEDRKTEIKIFITKGG